MTPRTIRLGVQLDDSDDPVTAARTAAAAEALGYDLAIASRAVAAWLAGRTERVALVVTTPDGEPATVTARAAASLDLLSGGRVTLVVGGAGEDEAGLHEAVGLVRRMWDTSAGPVHHAGVSHRAAGAGPGPLPAHDIPVWVRGHEPGAVEAAGSTADGWLGAPGDPRAAGGLDDLRKVLRRLDDSVEAAGRDPRELQRAVLVQGREQGDDLASLVTEHGVTTFVLRVDAASPADALERFARDVAPVLERAAQQALADGRLAARPLRRAEVRAQRRPGLDYDGLPATLAATAVEPGDTRYAAVRSTYLRGGSPGLVLRPRTPAEVSDALAFASRHRHLPLGLRSGGHGISGRSTNDGGLVVDVGALDGIEVLDPEQRLVRVGPGARWKQVAAALQPHGWAISSGDYGAVGVGGLATAGGIGFLGRKHGLTIDHLRAVELVLADGSHVRASADEHPELFWAVRGAGANFGVVTAFELVADEVPDVGWAQLAFQVADPAAFLTEFGRVVAAAPRETTPFLVMGRSGVAQVMAMVASDDPDVVVSQLQPFAEIAPMVQQQVVIAPYAAVMNMAPDAPHQGLGEPVSRSGLVTTLDAGVAEVAARLLGGGATYFFQLRAMGGAIGDVPPDATAFAHRDAAFSITAMGANAQRLDRSWDEMRPHLSGSYLSFETDQSPERIGEAFPPATLARLRALKAELDPSNLFRDNFNLASSPTSTTGSHT